MSRFVYDNNPMRQRITTYTIRELDLVIENIETLNTYKLEKFIEGLDEFLGREPDDYKTFLDWKGGGHSPSSLLDPRVSQLKRLMSEHDTRKPPPNRRTKR
jgi:hypothetical protein